MFRIMFITMFITATAAGVSSAQDTATLLELSPASRELLMARPDESGIALDQGAGQGRHDSRLNGFLIGFAVGAVPGIMLGMGINTYCNNESSSGCPIAIPVVGALFGLAGGGIGYAIDGAIHGQSVTFGLPRRAGSALLVQVLRRVIIECGLKRSVLLIIPCSSSLPRACCGCGAQRAPPGDRARRQRAAVHRPAARIRVARGRLAAIRTEVIAAGEHQLVYPQAPLRGPWSGRRGWWWLNLNGHVPRGETFADYSRIHPAGIQVASDSFAITSSTSGNQSSLADSHKAQ